MARLKIKPSPNDLDSIIEKFAGDKSQLDTLKKITEVESNQIKDLMAEMKISERSVGIHTVKRVVQTRESMNEERLLHLVKNSVLSEDVKKRLIKTREYIDMDSLEDAIYTNIISADFLLELDTCRETKEVVTLRLSKTKEDK